MVEWMSSNKLSISEALSRPLRVIRQSLPATACPKRRRNIYSKQMLDGYVQCFYREWPRITASMSSAGLCGQTLSVSALSSLVGTGHKQLLRTGIVAELLFNSIFYSLLLKLPHVANSIAREFIINWPNSIFIFQKWKLEGILKTISPSTCIFWHIAEVYLWIYLYIENCIHLNTYSGNILTFCVDIQVQSFCVIL